MLTTLILGFFTVFFSYLSKYENLKWGLKFSFILIFCFLALRFDFGNDYMYYYNNFQEISSISSFNIDNYHIKGSEIGWLLLNVFFSTMGFFTMNAVLAAFSTYALYKFIKKYVNPQYYWFAVFLYVFQPSQMLILSSAARQAVAVTLFLFAFDFIVEKKVVKYLLVILIATLFHTSAIFLFPLIFLGFFNFQLRFRYIIIILFIFIFSVINFHGFFQYINLITEQLGMYTTYVAETDVSYSDLKFGAGFALNLIIYFTFLFYSQSETNKKNGILFKIGIVSLLIIPIGLTIELASRLNYYLFPMIMAIYPIVFRKMKIFIKFSYMVVIILFTLYQFYYFFNSSVYSEYFKEYHTFFSSR